MFGQVMVDERMLFYDKLVLFYDRVNLDIHIYNMYRHGRLVACDLKRMIVHWCRLFAIQLLEKILGKA